MYESKRSALRTENTFMLCTFSVIVCMNEVYKQAKNALYGWGGFSTDPPTFEDCVSAIQTLPDNLRKQYQVLEYHLN